MEPKGKSFLEEGDGVERGQCCYLAAGSFLSTHPISSHFTHIPYGTGTLLTVALVVVPRVGGFAYILELCGPFKQTLLRDQKFLPLPQPPLVFTARSYKALICLALESWAARSGLGLGSFTPQVSLQVFICHM